MDTRKLRKRLAEHGHIAILWHFSDVKEVRPELTDDRAREVLRLCDSEHDANVGVCWDAIRVWAEHLFPEPDDSASDAEEGGAA